MSIVGCPEVLVRPECDSVLYFKDSDDIGLVLSGNKVEYVTPYNLGIRRFSIVTAYFNDSDISLRLYVSHTRKTSFFKLGNADAYRSGFNDVLTFKDDLKKRFKGVNDNSLMFVYGFKVVDGE